MKDLVSVPTFNWKENEKNFETLLPQLPQEMRNQISQKGLSLASSQINWKKQVENFLGLAKSVDMGGHGGTFCVKMRLENQDHYLFLKPFNEAEARNYQVIKTQSLELQNFMPKVYGEATLGKKQYLVMSNTRIDEHGHPLKQLLDIKLSGKVKGLDNPIANQDEMIKTQGKAKNFLDYMQMKFGADYAPDYMIASKGYRLLRLFHYSYSKKALIKALKGEPQERVHELKERLEELKHALEKSPLAFIGASIILIKNNDGSIKPLLIDPAHLQVNPKESDHPLLQGIKNIYFGTNDQYRLQRKSNSRSLKSLIADLPKK